MKHTLTTDQAARLLLADDNARWSKPAAYALVEHLEALEDDTGTEIEFCVVAIRCDWTEYDTAAAVAAAYSIDIEGLDEADTEKAVEKYLFDETQFIKLDNDNGWVIQNF